MCAQTLTREHSSELEVAVHISVSGTSRPVWGYVQWTMFPSHISTLTSMEKSQDHFCNIGPVRPTSFAHYLASTGCTNLSPCMHVCTGGLTLKACEYCMECSCKQRSGCRHNSSSGTGSTCKGISTVVWMNKFFRQVVWRLWLVEH
jgi:hypothetical protein